MIVHILLDSLFPPELVEGVPGRDPELLKFSSPNEPCDSWELLTGHRDELGHPSRLTSTTSPSDKDVRERVV